MNSYEYQELSSRTLPDKPPRHYSDYELMLIWTAMGIAGEAGEFVDHVKKGIFHEEQLSPIKVLAELGDLLWYISAFCTIYGLPLEQVMRNNIDKLKKRYPDGFVTGGGNRQDDTK
jgi:NTP pyrophosphatase (non-canonical NTP hydrolase)